MSQKKYRFEKLKELLPFSLHVFLKKIWTTIVELTKTLTFFFNSKGRKYLRSAYNRCVSSEEYFEFAVKVFDLSQVQEEVLDFLKYSADLNPKYVLEIGTFFGGLTFLLSQAIKTVSLTISIDLFKRNAILLHYFSKPGKNIKLISGSSYDPMTVRKVERILGSEKLDLLFIDGDHSYEGVKKDFLSYRRLVRNNGIIAFHDIVTDSFTRNGTRTGAYTGGVPEFYQCIKKLYPSVEFVKNPQGDGFGIGLIRYSSAVTVPDEL